MCMCLEKERKKECMRLKKKKENVPNIRASHKFHLESLEKLKR